MNLLKRELKSNLKSLLIWCASMAFLIYAGMVKYAAFAKTGDSVNEMMAAFPKEMLSVFGIKEGSDLTSVAVFYCIFFTYFLLLASVHGVMLGVTILSKEERDKTADFLFSKPVSRHKVIAIKFIAAFINILVFDFVTYLVSVGAVSPYYKEGSLTFSIFLVIIALFVIQFLFLCIGFCMAAVVKSAKLASSLASFLVLFAFLIKVMIDLNKDADFLTFLTPFQYFDPNAVLFDHQFDFGYFLLCIALAAFSTFCTFYFFKKKDLRT